MNHFIEVKEIDFKSVTEVGSTINYPESGVWKVKTDTSYDLVFIDKENINAFFICPMDIAERLGLFASKQNEITNMSTFINTPSGYVSEEFVLGFTKVLLSGKK